MNEFSCIVLCGGKSRRMGKNKAFIEINGKAIIDIIISQLEKLSKNIIVVVDKKEKYAQISRYESVKIFEDENKDFGPVEGMRIGLGNIDKKSAFICACDMPFINTKCISELYGYMKNDIACVIPKVGGKIHPLHGFYARSCAVWFDDMVKNNLGRIRYIFKKAKTEFVEQFDCDMETSVININKPDDLDTIKKRGVVYE